MSQPLVHDFADLGDVRLHYVTAGAGPVVVLLHGWPQTWYTWRKVLPGLAEGCGHWIPEQRPEWVVKRLLEFFAQA